MSYQSDRSLYWEAVGAYKQAVEDEGCAFDQPSESMSEISSKSVSLHNGNGKLAVYNIKTKKITLR